MEIQPVIAALRKHKIPATLIVLEIALACAVLCNAVFMIGHRLGEMHLPNAIDQNGIVDINVQGTDPKLANADIPRDVAALRKIPGVAAAAAANSLPLSGISQNYSVTSQSGGVYNRGSPTISVYYLGNGGSRALDLRLLQGRFFNNDEYAGGALTEAGYPSAHAAIVTRSLAQRLWSDGKALGRQFWIGKNAYTVVGIVANVPRPIKPYGSTNAIYWDAFFPMNPNAALTNYVIRTAPQNRQRVMRAAMARMETLSPNAVVKGQTFTDIRDKYFATTRSMVWMLVQVCIVMLLVTAFSIVGLTSFWVGQRRRQIGIRRALGASRGHIMQYFQTENFLLSTLGVVLGVILAYGANLYLMAHYQLDRMPWYYLPASAVMLWILGQLAVLGPALRASNVPPVVATRSV
ncbi:MAG TPA: FtsX-like permease family protein [Rhodanobacteraceae bacterium]|nr:FtsX-like permease family protein [Rhodanobacteraceae bacterium]